MKTKEQGISDYLEIMKKSCGLARLAEKEKIIFLEYLNLPDYLPQRTYKQVWKIVQNYYEFYLCVIEQINKKRFQ